MYSFYDQLDFSVYTEAFAEGTATVTHLSQLTTFLVVRTLVLLKFSPGHISVCPSARCASPPQDGTARFHIAAPRCAGLKRALHVPICCYTQIVFHKNACRKQSEKD